jgi:hypothetical protein
MLDKSSCRVFGVLTIIVFLLNLFWEYGQCGLFFIHLNLPPTHAAMLQVTLGDVLLAYIAWFVVSVCANDWYWFARPVWSRRCMPILLGIAVIVSVLIEWHALKSNRWSYTDIAPLVFGRISLLPVLQLVILFPLSLVLTRYCLQFMKQNG